MALPSYSLPYWFGWRYRNQLSSWSKRTTAIMSNITAAAYEDSFYVLWRWSFLFFWFYISFVFVNEGVDIIFSQFGQNMPCRASGLCLGSVIPLTYYSFFQEDLVIVSGQYLGSFRSILGSFWVVFGQKMTDWTAQSVIVNRWYLGVKPFPTS